MFRNMRRKKQLLPQEETIEIIIKSSAGVLGVIGDDGYPYTVPVSYAFKDDKIFIHSAVEGHKIDSIKRNDKVSFTVIEKDEVIQETFTTHFRSVIIFGKARILTDDFEKRYALERLVEKYSPDYIKKGQEEINKDWDRVSLIEIEIEHMTGKAAIEIVNASPSQGDVFIDLSEGSNDNIEEPHEKAINANIILSNRVKRQLKRYGFGEYEFLQAAKLDKFSKEESSGKHSIIFPLDLGGSKYIISGKKHKTTITIERIEKNHISI